MIRGLRLATALGFVGAALFALGIGLRPTRGLSSQEASDAFRTLASIPLRHLKGRGSIGLRVVVRSDPAWGRVTRYWGDPGYIIAVAAPPPSNEMYCLPNLALDIEASTGSGATPLGVADLPPYGYSASCRPVGVWFRMHPGTTVGIRVSERSIPPEGARGSDVEPYWWGGTLVVEPYWSGAMKDRLVSIAINEDLRPISAGLLLAGEVAVTLAALVAVGLWWAARGSRRKAQSRCN